MREILFRAKDDYGRWVFGSYVHSETHFPNDDKDFIIQRKVIGNSDFSQIPIDIETLGQFTGVRDKNGKKIFEGDILQSPGEWVEMGAVCWEEDDDGFPGSWCLYSNDVGALVNNINLPYFGHYEIVGNIYDNPDVIVFDKDEDDEDD